jgi:8-oxo-dGTP pyrophosphatase MutT (NUDIX family)
LIGLALGWGFNNTHAMESLKFPKSFHCYKPPGHKVYGSIIISPWNRILIVLGRKSNKWSFPKGHKKSGETYLECAIRETREETGVDLTGRVPVAYHKLSAGEYFFFEVDEETTPFVHDSREVIEAAWVSLERMARMSCNVDVNNFLDRIDRDLRA